MSESNLSHTITLDSSTTRRQTHQLMIIKFKKLWSGGPYALLDATRKDNDNNHNRVDFTLVS